MTLIINSHHHHRPNFIYSFFSKKFNFPTKFSPQFIYRRVNVNKGLVKFTVKSASVNGYTVRNHDDSEEVTGGDNVVGVTERCLRFIKLIPLVFPGGKWWRFSDDVEIAEVAKPVTLLLALQKMWKLIEHDQWDIVAAISALILTAVPEESCKVNTRVAQETFSLMRTVRVYGTELKELGRYNNWLEKLADISLRTSAAYGGMSIMAGQITAEQLTKFILYSEWLIYSTWFVGDNLSALMQSVGASEKVFQMTDLFTSKGSKLPNLKGSIDFVNVSFRYSSRETVHILQDINIAVNPYEVIALVGLSGSGKRTIVNLLLVSMNQQMDRF